MPAITIYSTPLVAWLTVEGVNSASGRFMITRNQYARSHFTIYRNALSNLDFLIKDVDRNAVAVSNTSFVITTLDGLTQIYRGDLALVDAATGHYRVAISPADSANLFSGSYRWSVIGNLDSHAQYLYTDLNYGARGTIDVYDGVPALQPAPFVFYSSVFGSDGQNFVSPVVPVDQTNVLGEHSAVYDLSNYTGTIKIQGTLDDAIPSDDTGWIDIQSNDYTAETSISHLPFQGNFVFIRAFVSNANGVNSITLL